MAREYARPGPSQVVSRGEGYHKYSLLARLIEPLATGANRPIAWAPARLPLGQFFAWSMETLERRVPDGKNSNSSGGFLTSHKNPRRGGNNNCVYGPLSFLLGALSSAAPLWVLS